MYPKFQHCTQRSDKMTRPVREILKEVKELAIEYYETTGKPLGITGEIGEFAASEIMGLELTGARQEGYDAIRSSDGSRIQVKARRLVSVNPGRVPKIDTDKEFDSVMLVMLGKDYKVREIWEARREAVITRLDEPGSKARNERRSMGVSQFKSIATKVWPL